MSEAAPTYGPTEAAELIKFAPSLLRRYAGIYEAQGGYVERDKRGGRLYTESQLLHFQGARERVQKGELLEDALRVLDLEPVEGLGKTERSIDAERVLGLLQRLSDENQTLRDEIRELRKHVMALAERPQLGTEHESELTRMNRYLLGELERRRLEAEVTREPRQWWKLWRR